MEQNTLISKSHYLYLLTAICLSICALFASLSLTGSEEVYLKTLADAEISYNTGMNATTISEKEAAFNRSVTLYQHILPNIQTNNGKAKLFFNLANSLYQLKNYHWAALYYYKSLHYNAGNTDTQKNLERTLEKLSVDGDFENTSIVHNDFIFASALHVLLGLTIFLFISCSLYIWLKNKWLKFPLVILTSSWVMLGAYTGYIQYTTPIEGLIIEATLLYRLPNQPIAQITEDPLISGRKVQVTEYTTNSEWIQIILPTGKTGFIPKKNMRLI